MLPLDWFPLFFAPNWEMYIDHKKDLYRSDTSQLNTCYCHAIAMLDVGSGFPRLQGCHGGFAPWLRLSRLNPWQPWPGKHVDGRTCWNVSTYWSGWWWLEHGWLIFHFIWDVILPIDELYHFSRWLKPPTSDAICLFHVFHLFHFEDIDAVWYNESEIDIWTHYEHPPWNYLYKIGNLGARFYRDEVGRPVFTIEWCIFQGSLGWSWDGHWTGPWKHQGHHHPLLYSSRTHWTNIYPKQLLAFLAQRIPRMIYDEDVEFGSCGALMDFDAPWTRHGDLKVLQVATRLARDCRRTIFTASKKWLWYIVYMHIYIYIYYYNRLSTLNTSYGSVSKPCTPGEHQNSW